MVFRLVQKDLSKLSFRNYILRLNSLEVGLSKFCVAGLLFRALRRVYQEPGSRLQVAVGILLNGKPADKVYCRRDDVTTLDSLPGLFQARVVGVTPRGRRLHLVTKATSWLPFLMLGVYRFGVGPRKLEGP